ncbi:hypothetical protein [Lysobacter gummosus]|uniref:hypothetical protein n=1 Tax=Lysobacter gummosus TaxID=262324 RepID=UPI0036408F47
MGSAPGRVGSGGPYATDGGGRWPAFIVSAGGDRGTANARSAQNSRSRAAHR